MHGLTLGIKSHQDVERLPAAFGPSNPSTVQRFDSGRPTLSVIVCAQLEPVDCKICADTQSNSASSTTTNCRPSFSLTVIGVVSYGALGHVPPRLPTV